MTIKMQGLEAAQVDNLLRFSRAVFGEPSYQGTSRYLQWLYTKNPYTKGLNDCLIALDNGAVVGCMHRMRLPCAGMEGVNELTSLQNHIVAPSVRSGVGLMLLRRSAKEAQLAFSPGVNARLAEAYRQLGYSEVPTHWLWKEVRPLEAAVQFAATKIWPGRRQAAALLVPRRVQSAIGTSVSVSVNPGETELAAMAAAMTERGSLSRKPHVAWSAKLVRWRYFERIGPASLLLGVPGAAPWAVLSYGVRNGLSVARLMEYEEAGDPGFMGTVLRATRGLGAAVLLGYTTDDRMKERLLATGWRLKTDPPFSFAIHARELSVGAAATDVGFEALATEVAV